MFIWTFLLRITHTIISQSIADSSWITLYLTQRGCRNLTNINSCVWLHFINIVILSTQRGCLAWKKKSIQLQSPAAVTPGKRLRYLLTGWVDSRAGLSVWRRDICLVLAKIEPRFLCRPTRCLVDINGRSCSAYYISRVGILSSLSIFCALFLSGFILSPVEVTWRWLKCDMVVN